MVAWVPPARSSSAEQPHQVERFRRGIHGRQHAPRQVILDGADQRRGVARRAQHRIDQIRRGGLAVGAGDAGEPEALVGLAVEVARRQRQRLPAVLHLNPARGQALRRGPGFAGHRHRAARQCVLGELAPVGAAARKSEEQVARAPRAANRTPARRCRRAASSGASGCRSRTPESISPSVHRGKPYANAFSLVQDVASPAGGILQPRATPLPSGITVKPFARPLPPAPRACVMPRKFGTVGPAGCGTGGSAGAAAG